MIFKKSKTEKKINHIHKILQASFGKVKQDTQSIFDWINYLHQQNKVYENEINELKNYIKDLHDSHHHTSKKIDDLHEISHPTKKQVHELHEKLHRLRSQIEHDNRPILKKLTYLDDKIESHKKRLSTESEALLKRLNLIEERIDTIKHFKPTKKEKGIDLIDVHKRIQKLEQKKSAIKQKIINRITKNSKEYIKTIILSYIKKYETISALQLKEMIVEEQGLCSKSSFYRILEEIEKIPEISTIRKGKEKHYMVKKVRIQ